MASRNAVSAVDSVSEIAPSSTNLELRFHPPIAPPSGKGARRCFWVPMAEPIQKVPGGRVWRRSTQLRQVLLGAIQDFKILGQSSDLANRYRVISCRAMRSFLKSMHLTLEPKLPTVACQSSCVPGSAVVKHPLDLPIGNLPSRWHQAASSPIWCSSGLSEGFGSALCSSRSWESFNEMHRTLSVGSVLADTFCSQSEVIFPALT